MTLHKEWGRRARLAFAVLGATGALLIVLGSRLSLNAQSTGSLNLVYVESNITTTNGNTVLGFSNTNGVLTPLSGSPYATGGAGVALGGTNVQFDADQQVIVNPEGTLLFAVNGHSDNISVFTINSDGSLTTAPGSPTRSGGTDPASLGLKDNAFGGGASLLVCVNKASDPNQATAAPNYTTFTAQSTGAITANIGSRFNITSGASPAQALIDPNQNDFFGIEFMDQQIVSYAVNKKGIITKLNSSTPPLPNPVVLGAAIDPKFKNTIYVALPASNLVAAYTYSTNGTLTYVTDIADPGQAPCWVAFDSTGDHLYVSDSASGTITLYNVSAPGKPSQLQHFSLALVNGVNPVPLNLQLDPTGAWLYVVDMDGALHVLSVQSDGKIAEPNAPVSLGLPAGTVPMGLATLTK